MDIAATAGAPRGPELRVISAQRRSRELIGLEVGDRKTMKSSRDIFLIDPAEDRTALHLQGELRVGTGWPRRTAGPLGAPQQYVRSAQFDAWDIN